MELMIVIVIIGILAAVGLVTFNNFSKTAKKNVMKANLNMIKRYTMTEFQKCLLGEEMEAYKKGISGAKNCSYIFTFGTEFAFSNAHNAIKKIHFKDKKSLEDKTQTLVDWHGAVPPKAEHLGRIMCFWDAQDPKGTWKNYMKNNQGHCTAKWGSGTDDYFIVYFDTVYDYDYHRGLWK